MSIRDFDGEEWVSADAMDRQVQLRQAAEQQRDRLRVKAGEARVHLEEGRPGKAHALLEEIRAEEEIEAAELQDREDDVAAAIEGEVGNE